MYCYILLCVTSGGLSDTERVLRPEVPFDVEEVTSLRKTCTELREVVRYMKRERDILEARQSVAEGETSRLESSLAVAQRALDEVRGELKRELDAKIAARGEGDFERLTAEVTQVSGRVKGGSFACRSATYFSNMSICQYVNMRYDYTEFAMASNGCVTPSPCSCPCPCPCPCPSLYAQPFHSISF